MKYDSFAKRLGSRVAVVRSDKDMTQAQLAREAGVSLKYVSMIESGTNPSIKTIMKICDALGTDLTDIMEKEGIGSLPGKKPARMRDVQVDLPSSDPTMKKLVRLIKGLDTDSRRRALRLIRTSFGD